MADDIRTLYRRIRRLGATIEPTRKGHVRITRNGATVFSYGERNQRLCGRNLHNLMAELVRRGVVTRDELEGST